MKLIIFIIILKIESRIPGLTAGGCEGTIINKLFSRIESRISGLTAGGCGGTIINKLFLG